MKINYFLLIILFLGAALRLGGLGDRPFDGDEGVMLQFASQPNISRTLELSRQDAHPPLGYLTNFISWHFLGQTEFWSRFFSALAGILLIYASYQLTQLYFQEKIARLTSLLVAISPHLIAFSQEDRTYSLLALFVVSTLYFFSQAFKEKDNFYFIGLAIFNLLMIYTHHIGWVIVAAEVIYWLAALRKNRQNFLPFFISWAIILLLFLPILNPTIRQFQGRAQDQPIGLSLKDSVEGLIKTSYRFGSGFWLAASPDQKYIYAVWLMIPLIITGHGLVFSKKYTKYSTKFLWLLIILCVIAALFFQEIGQRAERTLLFLAPLYLVYTSIGLTDLWNREAARRTRDKILSRGVAARLLTTTLPILIIISLYHHYFVYNQRPGADAIAQFLGKRLLPSTGSGQAPTDAIYIKGAFFSGESFILKYYLVNSKNIPIYDYYADYQIGNLAQIRTKNEQAESQKLLDQPAIDRVWFYDFSYTAKGLPGLSHNLGLDKENQPLTIWEIT